MFNVQDKRFKIAHREALIGVVLVVINFAIWYGFAYGLGTGDPLNITMFLDSPLGFSIVVLLEPFS